MTESLRYFSGYFGPHFHSPHFGFERTDSWQQLSRGTSFDDSTTTTDRQSAVIDPTNPEILRSPAQQLRHIQIHRTLLANIVRDGQSEVRQVRNASVARALNRMTEADLTIEGVVLSTDEIVLFEEWSRGSVKIGTFIPKAIEVVYEEGGVVYSNVEAWSLLADILSSVSITPTYFENHQRGLTGVLDVLKDTVKFESGKSIVILTGEYKDFYDAFETDIADGDLTKGLTAIAEAAGSAWREIPGLDAAFEIGMFGMKRDIVFELTSHPFLEIGGNYPLTQAVVRTDWDDVYGAAYAYGGTYPTATGSATLILGPAPSQPGFTLSLTRHPNGVDYWMLSNDKAEGRAKGRRKTINFPGIVPPRNSENGRPTDGQIALAREVLTALTALHLSRRGEPLETVTGSSMVAVETLGIIPGDKVRVLVDDYRRDLYVIEMTTTYEDDGRAFTDLRFCAELIDLPDALSFQFGGARTNFRDPYRVPTND